MAQVRQAVEVTLDAFLQDKAHTACDPHLPPLIEVLRGFIAAGGKRLRPVLCCCGWYATSRSGESASVVRIAAALELFHTFALIHDDIMDASTTRRGQPTVHRALLTHYRGPRDPREAELFGVNSAMLLGDLALVWSDELVHTGDLTPAQYSAVLPLLAEMRTEVMTGQYLDLLATGRATEDVETALRIARYKTAKYTVERPLQIGAALAGASPRTLAACTAYAIPLGEAFQLRDDVLGVFGDTARSGKSALEDLAAGKHTVLVALALRNADAGQRTRLHAVIGNKALGEHGAAEARSLLIATGALATVEKMIIDRRRRALTALETAGLQPVGTQALRELANAATGRYS
jgi:geranylgeranyl diphosphate synthase type I